MALLTTASKIALALLWPATFTLRMSSLEWVGGGLALTGFPSQFSARAASRPRQLHQPPLFDCDPPAWPGREPDRRPGSARSCCARPVESRRPHR